MLPSRRAIMRSTENRGTRSTLPAPRSATSTPSSRRSRIAAATYLRVRIDIEQRLKRDKDVSVTKLTYGTIETLDGQVLRLDTSLGRRAAASGARRRDPRRDEVHPRRGRRATEAGDSLGPRGARPLRPRAEHGPQADEGERKRTLKMFMPELNKICDIQPASRVHRARHPGRRLATPAAARRPDDAGRRQAEARVRCQMWVDRRGPGPQNGAGSSRR